MVDRADNCNADGKLPGAAGDVLAEIRTDFGMRQRVGQIRFDITQLAAAIVAHTLERVRIRSFDADQA